MFGKVIKILRKVNGFSAKKLATQVGISATYLSELENNKKEIHFHTLEKISSACNLKLREMLELMSYYLKLEEEEFPERELLLMAKALDMVVKNNSSTIK